VDKQKQFTFHPCDAEFWEVVYQRITTIIRNIIDIFYPNSRGNPNEKRAVILSALHSLI
jgi:hypothetical protein